MDREETGSEVWTDSAYCSRKNEKWPAGNMLTSSIQRRIPEGKPIGLARQEAKLTLANLA